MLKLLGALLIVVGLGGVFLTLGFRVPSSAELTLRGIVDIDLAENGDVYFSLMEAQRVQRYSADGKYLGGIDIHGQGGGFCVELMPDGLRVYIARRGIADQFDHDGRLVRENVWVDDRIRFQSCYRDTRVKAVDERLAAVVVSFADGRPPLVIERPLWLYLAFHPFVSWLIVGAGALLLNSGGWGLLRDDTNKNAPE